MEEKKQQTRKQGGKAENFVLTQLSFGSTLRRNYLLCDLSLTGYQKLSWVRGMCEALC